MENTFSNLEKCVIKWAKDKGIFEKGDKLSQATKMYEEAGELYDEVHLLGTIKGDVEALKMELGDVLVTLVVQANMNNTTLEDCLRLAYEKISKRKGKMVGGTFVKDE